jgi:DNA-binding NtrC family response regulator
VSRRSNSVLCIGSDAVLQNLRCSFLRKHGWTVFGSGSGYDGVMRFGQESVDAVVIDLNNDGTEAALIIGELKRLRPEVPVIILITAGAILAPGATSLADAIVDKAQENTRLIPTLNRLMKDDDQ